jgi:putative membrane protein
MNNKFNKLLILGLVLVPFTVCALQKQENVYEVLNRDGSRNNITVTNRLTYIGDQKITDETELRNILNISGDEEFELRKNNLTWRNSGKEILYRGETDKESPIKTKITYKLNNEDIDVNDLIGKDGDVEITINLTNTDYAYMHGNKIYTPFVTTAATIIDNEATNIDISNGKVVSNGNKNFAVSIAAPGLYESIDLNELKDLDKIVIKYHTNKFTYHDIYLVSTPKLLSKADLDVFNKLDKLTNDVNTLQTNMNKIQFASNKINDGTKSLNKYLKQANKGINKLSDGADKVSTGMNNLYTAFDQATNEETLKQLEELRKNDLNTIQTMSTSLITSVNAALAQYGSKPVTSVDDIGALIKNGTLTNEEVISTYKLIELLKYNYASVDSQIKLINNMKPNLQAINEGTKEIATNLKTVEGAITSITAGSEDLKNGMNELNSGIEEFNKEGINKLSSYTDKINNYSTKAKDLIKLSTKYNGFTSNNTDETIFITVIK